MQQPKIIIAVDGYSSSGKSSMAKALAKAVEYNYVDTGAMYRAVTLYAMRHGMIAADGTVNADAVTNSLPKINITFDRMPDGSQHTFLNGEDVEKEIRGLEVSNNVSPVSAIPAVRHDLVKKQQAFGIDKAPAETRAERRLKELQAKGDSATYEAVLENIKSRDYQDENRKESPLRRAADAIDLDNSYMTIEQQDEWLLSHFKEAVAKAAGK